MKRLFWVLLVPLLLPTTSSAQVYSDSLSVVIGLSNYMNISNQSSALPFWFHSEKYGVVDQSSANSILSSEVATRFINTGFVKIDAGADLIIRGAKNNSVFFNQVFLDATIGGFKLTGGKFYDPQAQFENELSTGSLMVSRNASPMPKIAFYTDDFITVPFLQGYINYKGYFSHGWQNDDRFTKGVYVHQKYFYMNLDIGFLYASGGITHNAQWGGENETSGKFPRDFNAFKDILFARGSSSSEALPGEQANVAGNSIATYDFRAATRIRAVEFYASRIFYLEDGHSRHFRSPWDGIWSAGFIFKKARSVQKIHYEHLNFKRQDSYAFEPYGTASYYNHWLYRTGWTYEGRVIGNSLALSDGSLDRPVYNNIIIAHHIGIKGVIDNNIDYTFKYTYSRNYGVFQDQIIEQVEPGNPIVAILRPLNEVLKLNHSFYLEVQKPLPSNEEILLGAAISTDIGELYSSSVGVGFSISYQLY